MTHRLLRRRFLASVGTAISLAGCQTDSSEPVGTDTESATQSSVKAHQTATPSAIQPATADTPSSVDASQPATNPHGFVVKNAADSTRTVEVSIQSRYSDETILERTDTLDGGEQAKRDIHRPATVQIHVVESGTTHATSILYFDSCNTYSTTVRIHPDDTITSSSVSTMLACPE